MEQERETETKGPEIRKVGALCTVGAWEDLLVTLPSTVDPSREGPGLMWQNVTNPRTEGNDPIVRQGWRLATVRGCRFVIGEKTSTRCEIIKGLKDPNADVYTLIKVDGVNLHLRGVEIEERNGKKFIRGDFHVCARVFWPKGADTREAHSAKRGQGKNPWRNYCLYIDVTPPTAEITQYFRSYPAGTQRSVDNEVYQILGKGGRWAHTSANFNSASGEGVDQFFLFGEIEKKQPSTAESGTDPIKAAATAA